MKSSCPALCRASTSLLQPRKTWMAGTSPAMTKKEVRKVLPHHFAAALRDQPRGALIAHIDPQPADRDAEPVAQADQEVDVGDTPYPPCQGAAQLDAPEIDHRLALADLRQAAGMLVSEQSRRAAAQARLDGIRDIASLLFGCRRNAGAGPAPAAKQQGRYVADAIKARLSGGTPALFRYQHAGSLAQIGKRKAVIDFGRIKLRGTLAWWIWGIAHIYFLIGLRNRLSVAISWLWVYVRDQRAARLITQGSSKVVR